MTMVILRPLRALLLGLMWTSALAGSVAASQGPDFGPGFGRGILFIRGGPGTGGFLEGGADEQLSDIFDLSVLPGNHAWGELSLLLTASGFRCFQLVEGPSTNNTPIDFGSVQLSQFSVVVLGSNNAGYSEAAADQIEAYVRAGGGLLVISDANWGSSWGDAPTSDQTFLNRFGLVMNQDTGLYVLRRSDGDFVVNGQDMGRHPILAGPDGMLGTGDEVDAFDGEGVSPITVVGGVPGVEAFVIAKAEGSIHVNDSMGSGSFRPAGPNDGALVVAEVEGGRVVGHFDRNTFFNLNGAGTSLHRFDNTQYALNLFQYLAGPLIVSYGTPKTNSLGLQARLTGGSVPSVLLGGVRLDVTGAVPGNGLTFFGDEYANTPLLGGTLLVGGPVVRVAPVQVASDGTASTGFRIFPEMLNTTKYAQFWYRDLGDPFGSSLSDAVRVRIVP